MDPYRYRPPSSRYGKSTDLSLLSVFVLTLLLLVGVVAALIVARQSLKSSTAAVPAASGQE